MLIIDLYFDGRPKEILLGGLIKSVTPLRLCGEKK